MHLKKLNLLDVTIQGVSRKFSSMTLSEISIKNSLQLIF
ncbi:hypothetical protein CKA32_001254 [Geitlerinema sp. FC II]|nr:hypothetical protein CKA32_001254 [Geitlerinema sp. FC II]